MQPDDSATKTIASDKLVIGEDKGKKWPYFDKRSTMTKIIVLLQNGGILVTKSMEMSLKTILGMGNG